MKLLSKTTYYDETFFVIFGNKESLKYPFWSTRLMY